MYSSFRKTRSGHEKARVFGVSQLNGSYKTAISLTDGLFELCLQSLLTNKTAHFVNKLLRIRDNFCVERIYGKYICARTA